MDFFRQFQDNENLKRGYQFEQLHKQYDSSPILIDPLDEASFEELSSIENNSSGSTPEENSRVVHSARPVLSTTPRVLGTSYALSGQSVRRKKEEEPGKEEEKTQMRNISRLFILSLVALAAMSMIGSKHEPSTPAISALGSKHPLLGHFSRANESAPCIWLARVNAPERSSSFDPSGRGQSLVNGSWGATRKSFLVSRLSLSVTKTSYLFVKMFQQVSLVWKWIINSLIIKLGLL